MRNVKYLNDEQTAMWVEAGTHFPGEQLIQILQRTLQDLQQDHCPDDVYALHRDESPPAYDALVTLEGRGIERRHIYVEPRGERDVLHIDVTLFDLIAQAIALLLDVMLRIFGASPPVAPPVAPMHVPSWQRQPRLRHGTDRYEP